MGKERKIWYEFKSTMRFEMFIFFAEYCRFLDKQKRTLRFSFEAITPKKQYLLFESEIVFENCCPGSYESVNVSTFVIDFPQEQSNAWFGSDIGETCIGHKVIKFLITEEFEIEYTLGADTLKVVTPMSTLHLLETPTINVGLSSRDTVVYFNGVQLTEQIDALNQLKQVIHKEKESAAESELGGMVELVLHLENKNKCHIKKIVFNLPKYRFPAERNNFYKIDIPILVAVKHNELLSRYLWNS